MTSRARGFTMPELLMAVAIAAILTTVAVPSFNSIIATQRARTYASALYATLSQARSQAVRLNANVTLQAKAGGWQNGWQILDANNNVLDDYTATTGINVGGPGVVTYSASGRLAAGSAVPVFQINTTYSNQTIYQCVSVTLSGRPYMTATPAC
jgi:type IV fimbrial biogenesis protein FimT